jgi:nitrous oxide reductase accessory protein NosL
MSMLALALVPACGDTAPTGPPELRLGADVCDRCAMAIAEPRYAAAALVDDEGGPRTLIFDDIGCLAIWEAGASGATLRRRWVHDRPTGVWTDASTATFSQTRELTTPMGSGIAAFTSASDADALVADRGGEKLSWDAILARAREGTLQVNPFPRHEAAR